MANLKSAKKRVLTTNKKQAQNQSLKSEMRSQIKHVESLIEANDVENAKAAFQRAAKKIDQTVQKGLIHKNNGNRQKSRLAKGLKSVSA